MKKLIIGLLILGCILVYTPVPAQALRVHVYGMVNNAPTPLVSAVPITTIIPRRHRLVGISIINIAPGTNGECYASVEDAVKDAQGLARGEIIVENETGVGGGSKWFDYPITLETQAKIHQGAYTQVLLYYAR